MTESTRYTDALGYGWVSGTVDSRDLGALSGTSSLTTHLNFTTNGIFGVEIANSTYDVKVYLGDAAVNLHDQMGVALENGSYDSVTTAKGQVLSKTYGLLSATAS